jgi:hypothetical protein
MQKVYCQRVISGAEVLATAMTATLFFKANQKQARLYISKKHRFIAKI